jgi:hypothetical protein
MAGTRYPDVFQQLIVDPGEQLHVDVVGLEGVGILTETDRFQPIPYCAHAAGSSCSRAAMSMPASG